MYKNVPLMGPSLVEEPTVLGSDVLASTIAGDPLAKAYLSTSADPFDQSTDVGAPVGYPDGSVGLRRVELRRLGLRFPSAGVTANYYNMAMVCCSQGTSLTNPGFQVLTGHSAAPGTPYTMSNLYNPAGLNPLLTSDGGEARGVFGMRVVQGGVSTESLAVPITVYRVPQSFTQGLCDALATWTIAPVEMESFPPVKTISGGVTTREVLPASGKFLQADWAASTAADDETVGALVVTWIQPATAVAMHIEFAAKLEVAMGGEAATYSDIYPLFPIVPPAYSPNLPSIDAWLATHQVVSGNSFKLSKELARMSSAALAAAPAAAAIAAAAGQPEVAALIEAAAVAATALRDAKAGKAKAKRRRKRKQKK